MTRYAWTTILDRAQVLHAAELDVVGVAPTLRRLHYLLVSDAEASAAGYVNTQQAYKALSAATARAREAGTFPDLSERVRFIDYAAGSTGMPDLAEEALRIAQGHRLRRDLALPIHIVLIVEKDGVMPLLGSRFGWLSRSALNGYNSVTHMDRLAALADVSGNTVGLYLGDYDPSGLDITRDLTARLPYRVRRVGLSWEQCLELGLPPAPPKAGDPRRARMLAEHGHAVQVELDAAPAAELLTMISDAITDESGVTLRDDGLPDLPDLDRTEQAQRDLLAEEADIVAEALGGDES